MKRVLISGATGFVGAKLARRVLKDGYQVHLIVRPGHTTWRIESLRKDARLYETDLEDREALAKVVHAIRPDWVFHLAAYGAYSWETDFERMIRVNLGGTANLIDACLRTGFEALVNTGSSSEYGFKDHPARESELLEPNSHYALTKAAATHLAAYTARSAGIRIPTLRLYSIYGPFEEPNRLMPTLITYGLEGKLPPLVSPHTARDYVYVDDVVDAYLLAASRLDAPHDAIYNVGSGAQMTIAEVVDVARRVLNIATEPQWESMESRHWDTSHWVSNAQKIGDALGWKASTTFEQGFARMKDWLGSDQAMLAYYRQAIFSK